MKFSLNLYQNAPFERTNLKLFINFGEGLPLCLELFHLTIDTNKFLTTYLPHLFFDKSGTQEETPEKIPKETGSQGWTGSHNVMDYSLDMVSDKARGQCSHRHLGINLFEIVPGVPGTWTHTI